MLMVLIVHMRMRMFHHLMLMHMLVAVHLGDMEPDSRSQTCGDERGPVTGSRKRTTAASAPKKGAIEKYAPVRALPR